MTDVTSGRVEYRHEPLDEAHVPANPFALLQTWLADAVAAELPEPNAMTLATATLEGRPSARMVLLRGLDEAGLVFYTNYASRKGRELEQNPFAALVLFWQPLHRSVRVEGRVVRVAAEESDAYFAARPRGNQLSAAASRQSERIRGPRHARAPRRRARRALSRSGAAALALGRLPCHPRPV